jgi:hypothetical protein
LKTAVLRHARTGTSVLLAGYLSAHQIGG